MQYKIYEKVLDSNYIDEFLNSVNKEQFHDGRVGTRVNLKQKRRKDLFLSNTKHLTTLDNKIYEKIYFDVRDNFSDIKYREPWKLGYYHNSNKGFYNLHTDTAGNSGEKARKTSVVCCLSNKDDYTGGELHFPNLKKQFKLDKGDLIAFDSNLLHGVKPVLTGERYVLISFMFDDEGGLIRLQHKPSLHNYKPKLKYINLFYNTINNQKINANTHIKNLKNAELGDIDYSDKHPHSWTDKDDYLHEKNNSDTLLVSFAGMGWRTSIPTFNFYNMLSTNKSIDKLFLRDITCRYYMTGLRNTTKNLKKTLDFVQNLIVKNKYKRVFAIGCSAGGFAAILFGHLLKFNKVVVFSPQTVLNHLKEEKIKDLYNAPKTCKWLRNLNKDNFLFQRSLDLKNFSPFSTKIDIHYSSRANKGADKNHAKHIEGENCKIIEYDSNNHLLALELKKQNKLKLILENLVK